MTIFIRGKKPPLIFMSYDKKYNDWKKITRNIGKIKHH